MTQRLAARRLPVVLYHYTSEMHLPMILLNKSMLYRKMVHG